MKDVSALVGPFPETPLLPVYTGYGFSNALVAFGVKEVMMPDTERRTVIPPRRSRVSSATTTTSAPDIEEDDSYYTQRPHSSARGYQQSRPTGQRTTEAHALVPQGSAISRVDAFGRPVIRQGNRDYVMVPANTARPRFHWSVFLGLTMLVMIIGWIALSALGTWWTDWRNYTDYGYPRTWQTEWSCVGC